MMVLSGEYLNLDPALGNIPRRINRVSRRGFTLVDVMVTMVVISVLIGIMIPSMAAVRETTQRVVCSSNIRQIGLGVSMFADDNNGLLPQSGFVNTRFDRIPRETTRLRIASHSSFAARHDDAGRNNGIWDGLGRLFDEEYLETRGIFYCPSHSGDNEYEDQIDVWNTPDGDLTGNYQYRGEGPTGDRRLFQIVPRRSAIVSDSIHSEADLNHEEGINVLRADLAVFWFSDLNEDLRLLLQSDAADSTDQIWGELDLFVGPGGSR